MTGESAKLSGLRAKADQARRAVTEEEDRQRDAYNAALDALFDGVMETLAGVGWVHSESRRKHERRLSARPSWTSGEDFLLLTFAYSEENTPDLHEDLTGTAVSLTDKATGNMIRFNWPPPQPMLRAVIESYTQLADPPDQPDPDEPA